MRYTKLYADEAGASHFREVDVDFRPTDFAPPAPLHNVSPTMAAERFFFINLPAGWDGSWHPAPHEQFLVCTRGMLEITVRDGHVLRFGPGDVIFVDDIHSRGHRTRVVGDEEFYGVMVQIPETPATR